jgi:hypothetical protein
VKRMVGPGGLEPLTSSVSRDMATTGARRINGLRVRLSATVGFIGQGRAMFVQRFVQHFDRCPRPLQALPKRELSERTFLRGYRPRYGYDEPIGVGVPDRDDVHIFRTTIRSLILNSRQGPPFLQSKFTSRSFKAMPVDKEGRRAA